MSETPSEASTFVRFSFRFKLMLIMAGVVGLFCIALLIVIPQIINSVYENYLQQQTIDQLTLFKQKQELGLKTLETALKDSSQNVRIFAALDAENYELVYNDLFTELKYPTDRIQRNLEDTGEKVFGPFFRFVNADNIIIPPVEMGLAGYVRGVHEIQLAENLSPIANTFIDEYTIHIGYRKFESLGRSMIYKIIVGPIYDEREEELWGKVIFAVPIIGDEISPSTGKVKNAFATENTIYSDDISPLHQAEILSSWSLFTSLDAPVTMEFDDVKHQVYKKRVDTAPGFPDSYLVVSIPMTERQKLTETIRLSVLVLVPIALFIAIILSIIVSHRMTRPIVNLVKGFESVGQGNLAVTVPVTSNDEMGNASRRFNDMVYELAQKELMRDILDKTTDKRIADDLLKGNLTLGGETASVSILFCDIREFTPLTDGMDPQKVVQMLNEHMTALTKVVYKHYGIVDKFVGDEIMVLFGALSKEERNDAQDAVECGLAMVEERQKLNAVAKHPIQIGIGIATGSVVAGRMGSDDRLNYTVLGDRVNLAARLCSQAKPMEVLIDLQTKNSLSSQFETQSLETIQLKGFTDPVQVYCAISHQVSDISSSQT